jgi:hypothetical protein
MSCVLCPSEATVDHHISYDPVVKVPLCGHCHKKEHPTPRKIIVDLSKRTKINVNPYGQFYLPVDIRKHSKLDNVNISSILGFNACIIFQENTSAKELLKSLDKIKKMLKNENCEEILNGTTN